MLVTGAGGQLGRDVVEAAIRAGHDVRGFGSAELDVRDLQRVLDTCAALRPVGIVHCAAYTAVDDAEGDRDRAFAVNELGSRHIALAANDVGAHLVAVSTDYVFDGANPKGYVESDATDPINVYGASKLAGEAAVTIVAPGACIVRSSWIFGAHGDNFVKTIARLAVERDAIDVVDDQIGTPTYTGHLARALVECMHRRLTGVLHLAGAPPVSWHGLAREVVAAAGARCEVRTTTSDAFPRPAPRPACSILRSTRPDAPPVGDWREGVRAVVAALRSGAAA